MLSEFCKIIAEDVLNVNHGKIFFKYSFHCFCAKIGLKIFFNFDSWSMCKAPSFGP